MIITAHIGRRDGRHCAANITIYRDSGWAEGVWTHDPELCTEEALLAEVDRRGWPRPAEIRRYDWPADEVTE